MMDEYSSGDAGKTSATPLLALLPASTSPLDPSSSPLRRADLLALKSRLAALLPADSGHFYWAALVDFLSGSINREELGHVMRSVLGDEGEAVQLHNALLLSILYNTTHPTLPPSTVRHSGWHKRKRDKDGHKLEDRDPQRRKLKAQVMALGKKERADLKALALVKRNGALAAAAEGAKGAASAKSKDKGKENENENERLLSVTFDSKGGRVGKNGLPMALEVDDAALEVLRQDYLRCLQAQHCSESKVLPDMDSLRDRMTLIAYENGLAGGSDATVAALGVVAVETHLKAMITSVISLLRSNRAAGLKTSDQSQLNLLADISEVAPTTTTASTSASHPNPVAASRDSPLCATDFAALFDISPYLLVQSHVASVERLYAIPSSDEDSMTDDDDDDLSSDGEEEAAANVDDAEKVEMKSVTLRLIEEEQGSGASNAAMTSPATVRSSTTAGKSVSSRRLPGRARSSSTASKGVSSGGVGAVGRDKYVIDPSMIHFPWGHPDVAQPRIGGLGLAGASNGGAESGADGLVRPSARRAKSSTLPRSNGAAGGGGGSTPQLSPKALRAHLFPDHDMVASPLGAVSTLAMDGISITGAEIEDVPASPSNNTSTDGTDSDEAPAEGLRSGVPGGARGGRGGIMASNRQSRKADNWQVVDSIKLIDG